MVNETKSPSVKDLLKQFERKSVALNENPIEFSTSILPTNKVDNTTESRPGENKSEDKFITQRGQLLLELISRNTVVQQDSDNHVVPSSSSRTKSAPEKASSIDFERITKRNDSVEFTVPPEKADMKEDITSGETESKDPCYEKKEDFPLLSLERLKRAAKKHIIDCVNCGTQRIKKNRDIFIEALLSFPIVSKMILYQIHVTKSSKTICFFVLILSMIPSFYPTVSSNNTIVTTMIWILSCKARISKTQYATMSVLVILSLVVDIMWLFGDNMVYPLGDENDSYVYMFELRQRESLILNIAWYTYVLSILGKIFAHITMFKQEKLGRKLLRELWEKVHIFLPPGSLIVPESVYRNVESRIIAIFWLKLVFTSLLLSLNIYSHSRYFWVDQFASGTTRTSLINLMYIKIFFEILFLVSVLRYSSMVGIVSEFCSCPFIKCYSEDVKVRLDRRFFRCTFITLICGLGASAFVWISMESSIRMDTSKAPKEVHTILYIMLICLAILDVYCTILFSVIYCYAFISQDQFPVSIQNEELNYDFGYSISSSQNLFERRLESAETVRPKMIFLMDSNIDCDDDQFEEYWREFPQHFQLSYKTSRLPSLDECQQILASHNFYTVASGYLDSNLYKMFLIGKSGPSLFLAQMTINPAQRSFTMTFKSNFRNFLTHFIEKLPFDELFGARRQIHSIPSKVDWASPSVR